MTTFSIDQGGGRQEQLMKVLVTLRMKRLTSNARLHVNALEVGSYVGQSAVFWSRSIARMFQEGGALLCIDLWEGFHTVHDLESDNAIYRQMDAALRSGGALNEFVNNVREASDSRCPVKYLVGDLPTLSAGEQLKQFGKFDLIYVDGSHYYKDVVKDLRIAQELIAQGGVICGDDLERQIPDVTEEECRAYEHQDYIHNYHPGVTRAVAEVFGRVQSENGIWAVWQPT